MAISKRCQELLLNSDFYVLVRVHDLESSCIHHRITQEYFDSHDIFICKFGNRDSIDNYLMEVHDYYRYVFTSKSQADAFLKNINPRIQYFYN